MTWTLQELQRNVHQIDWTSTKEDNELWVLVCSDIHWDNPHCDQELFKQHMDEALAYNAPIIICGDFFCAMQGKYDRRSNKDDIRPEHQKGEYLDKLVDTAAAFLQPYAKNLAVLGLGNHETAIRKNHETDLTDRLTAQLRAKGGITRAGGYDGWVRFKIGRSGTTSSSSYRAYYHHGHGGAAPVTKGKIQFNRHAEWVDADAIWLGHVHWKECFPTCRVRLNDAGREEINKIHNVRLGCYKQEYGGGVGWHIEGGRGPRPQGGYWLKLSWKKTTKPRAQFIHAEYHEAD